MVAATHPHLARFEDLLAELTIAAYDVTLKYHTGRASLFETEDSFIDAELELWTALRRVLEGRVTLKEQTPLTVVGNPSRATTDSLTVGS